MEDKQRGKRRYSRVLLEILDDKVREVVGALAEWPGGQILKVFDMSYSGVAVQNFPEFKVYSGQQVVLHFHLGGCDDEEVEAKVVWFNSQIIGLEFTEQPEYIKERLTPFLHDKLLGLNLHLVPKEISPPWCGFTYWYHGPRDTNVYVWATGERIDRAFMTVEGQVLLVADEKVMQTVIEGSFDETNPSFDPAWAKAKPALPYLLRRFMDILSQAQAGREILQALILVLVQATENVKTPA